MASDPRLSATVVNARDDFLAYLRPIIARSGWAITGVAEKGQCSMPGWGRYRVLRVSTTSPLIMGGGRG